MAPAFLNDINVGIHSIKNSSYCRYLININVLNSMQFMQISSASSDKEEFTFVIIIQVSKVKLRFDPKLTDITHGEYQVFGSLCGYIKASQIRKRIKVIIPIGKQFDFRK